MKQVIFITGSSTGFGYDTALRLARRGHRVFATMRDTARRNATARESIEKIARDEHLRLDVLELDVTQDGSVRAAVDSALSRTPHLDVVINNAGTRVWASRRPSPRSSSTRCST